MCIISPEPLKAFVVGIGYGKSRKNKEVAASAHNLFVLYGFARNYVFLRVMSLMTVMACRHLPLPCQGYAKILSLAHACNLSKSCLSS